MTGKKTPLFAPVTVIDGTQTRKVCYKGITGDVETQATNIEFVEDLIDLREYTKAEGFLFNTATTEFKGKKVCSSHYQGDTSVLCLTGNAAWVSGLLGNAP